MNQIDFPALLQTLNRRDQQFLHFHRPAVQFDHWASDDGFKNIWAQPGPEVFKSMFVPANLLYSSRPRYLRGNYAWSALLMSRMAQVIADFENTPAGVDPEWGVLKNNIEALDPSGQLKVEIKPIEK